MRWPRLHESRKKKIGVQNKAPSFFFGGGGGGGGWPRTCIFLRAWYTWCPVSMGFNNIQAAVGHWLNTAMGSAVKSDMFCIMAGVKPFLSVQLSYRHIYVCIYIYCKYMCTYIYHIPWYWLVYSDASWGHKQIPRLTTRLSTPMAQDNQSFHLKLLIWKVDLCPSEMVFVEDAGVSLRGDPGPTGAFYSLVTRKKNPTLWDTPILQVGLPPGSKFQRGALPNPDSIRWKKKTGLRFFQILGPTWKPGILAKIRNQENRISCKFVPMIAFFNLYTIQTNCTTKEIHEPGLKVRTVIFITLLVPILMLIWVYHT